MHNKQILFLTLIFSSLFFCAKKPDPIPVWNFEPEGITIHFKADKLLNVFNDEPHTVVMIVYQLTVIDAFNNLAKSEDGLKKLLREEYFDQTVVSIDRIIVQPEDTKTLVVDRAEKARWVGIVAGYYELIPGQVNLSFNIPFTVRQTGRLWKKEKTAKVNNLHIKLLLGTRGIQKAGTL